MADISAEQKISIKAKPNEVFAYLKDLNLHYLWNPTLSKISSKEVLGLGKSYSAKNKVMGINIRGKNKVVQFDDNKRIELENKLGLVRYKLQYNLSSRMRHTIVTCKVEITTKNQAFGLTLPILKQLASKELQTDLTYLKIAVENKLAEKIQKN